MARGAKNQPPNIQRLVQLNDDDAEKRRRRSSIRQAADTRRASIAAVARDTFRRGPQESSVPLMANFEEWMKLVKDNKINQSNSWNFALIDYFHDMAVLKEGDGINFQKASYTLDGCVKIYTSRVDSVASETGKLLSGLADGGKGNKDDATVEDGEGSENENEEAAKQRQRRRKNRSENTLASNFSQIQVKNLDLELSVDPLFRKMCADFNEGGAKGLLLNSLAIDNTGRVVFDGQVDQQPEETEQAASSRHIEPVNLTTIRESFFPQLSVDNLTICPSLPMLQSALKDPSMSTASEFIKDIETHRLEDEGAFAGDIGDFDDDVGGFDLDPMMGDHEESRLEFGVPDFDIADPSNISGENLVPGGAGNGVAVVMNPGAQEGDIMAYFDETLRKNWAGPEHWKVQKIKGVAADGSTETSGPVAKKRAEKQVREPFLIDFLSTEEPISESVLFTDGGSYINLPKTQHKSKTRNLLPDDQHFSSQSIIKLFLKPKAQMFHKVRGAAKSAMGSSSSSSSGNNIDEDVDIDVDENFFAENYQGAADQEAQQGSGDYDANFFQGEDDDGVDPGFNDEYDDAGGGAPLYGAPGILGSSSAAAGGGGLLLGNRRARPEYVNYAKTAKKVNIKLLKDNIWNTLDITEVVSSVVEPAEPAEPAESAESMVQLLEKPQQQQQQEERKFTEVIQDLKSVYAPQQMTDISTSFCFICLLHLANEKGLVIENNEDNTELTIRKDMTVSQAELSA